MLEKITIFLIFIFIISFGTKLSNLTLLTYAEGIKRSNFDILIYPKSRKTTIKGILKDPQNQFLGIDPNSNSILRQIPYSDYSVEFGEDDITINHIEILVPTILDGSYQLKIYKETAEEYELQFGGVKPQISHFFSYSAKMNNKKFFYDLFLLTYK